MRRCAVLAVLLLLWLAPPAGATVSVVLGSPDPDALYAPGETITLTVRVTANAGETAYAVQGRLAYSSTALFGAATAGQNPLPPFGPNVWLTGNPLICTSSGCIAFNQITSDGNDYCCDPYPVNVTDFLLSTMMFTVSPSAPLGAAGFSWRTTPFTQRFDFFGLTTAPGYSVTIVPEPSTSLLLGVGLLGLALAARRSA